MLKVAYLNINGLTATKLNNLRNTLEMYDVIFLAETWHCATLNTVNHPMFVGKTPNITKRTNSRQGNGIAVFANQLLRLNLQIIRASEYFITLRFENSTLSAVYLPPSLDGISFKKTLEDVSNSDVILGDFNVAFGAVFGSSVSGPPGRREIFDTIAKHSNFSHLKPRLGNTKWDHVLSKIPCNFDMVETPVPSDHPMIALEIDITSCSPRLHIDNKPTRRFFLRKLQDNTVVSLLKRMYMEVSEDFQTHLQHFQRDLPRLSVEQRCIRLDKLEQELVDNVSVAAEKALGSYTVNVQKKQPDNALDQLAEEQSQHAVIQLFKRGCRNASTHLASLDPHKTLDEEVETHFGRVFQSPQIDVQRNPVQPNFSHLFHEDLKLSNDTLDAFAIGDRDWTGHFSVEAVRRFLWKYDTSKACGMDALHTKILIQLVPGPFDHHLSWLLQLFALTGITPSRWNKSVVYPLKKKQDAVHIQDCRPIALTAMFRRVFEALLLTAIQTRPDCLGTRLFHPTQAGFRKGHSTLLHAAFSNDLASLRPRPERVFIDFKQAYDRVPLELLIKKLQQRNTPPVVVSLILSMFSRCSIQVVVNGRPTNPIQLYSGLFQGSLLAPFLFLVFIDDLAEALAIDSTPAIPNALLFADDLELVGVGARLQGLCDIVTEWSDMNGMSVGINKCGHIGAHSPILVVQRQLIPVVTSYPYLGFPHEINGINFETHVSNMESKARKVLNACLLNGSSWPEWAKLTIYKTFMRSRLEYGGQLLVHHLDKTGPLQALQDDALRWILPYAPHSLSAAAVTAVAPMETRFETLAVSFSIHCLNMAADHPSRRFIGEVCGSGPWSPGILLPRATSLPLARTLVERSTNGRVLLSTILRKYTLEKIEMRSTIARYISRRCRRKTYGPDKTLFWKNTDIRKLALLWRVGSFGCRLNCPSGCHRFNRACVMRCIGEDNDATATVPRHRRPKEPPDHYCLVDDIINLEAEEVAGKCLRQLQDILS